MFFKLYIPMSSLLICWAVPSKKVTTNVLNVCSWFDMRTINVLCGAICPLCVIRGEPNHAPVLPLKNPSAYTLLSFRLFSRNNYLFCLCSAGLGFLWEQTPGLAVGHLVALTFLQLQLNCIYSDFWELRELCAKNVQNFYVKIHGEIDCQSWLLLTPFFNLAMVQGYTEVTGCGGTD